MPSKSTARVTVACAVCAAPFETWPSRLAAGRGRFCSLQCKAESKCFTRWNDSTPLERFVERIDVDGPVLRAELGNCWVWTGATVTGRGRIVSTQELAPRCAWRLLNGPVPDGLFVCHKCDGGDIGCLRPDHLYLGTHQDNMDDKVNRGRCPRGEDAGRALLTEDAVRSIRARHAAGESRADLAREYGVAWPTIGMVVLRRTWKHVD